MPERRVGWQPSRFLTDRAEAEHAFTLAERSAASMRPPAALGNSWRSLRRTFTRCGLGTPALNPEAGRQRAIAAACQRAGRPTTGPWTPGGRGPQGQHSPGLGMACG